jgi:hypothetical protein
MKKDRPYPLLDSALLQRYMLCFYGCGELSADYWFVGMEQGGGSTEREVEFNGCWKNQGRFNIPLSARSS